MRKTILSITALFLAVFFSMTALTSCGGDAADDGKLKVVATVFPQYDFARQVSGGKANVEMLVMPGGDTHTYEFPPRDMIKINSCDLFIFTGGGSDEWIRGTIASMKGEKPQTLALTDIISPAEEVVKPGMTAEHDHGVDDGHDHGENESHDHEQPEYDEHVWTSPKNAAAIVAEIADQMSALDPANAEAYMANAASYISVLNELDKDFRSLAGNTARNTLVFGDRFPFRYLADEYGLDYYAAFPGCSSETEPSVAGMKFLIEKVKAEKIPVVFTIEFSNQKIAKTLAEETGAKILELHSCHNVSKSDFKDGITYAALMRRNLENIKTALN